MPNAREIAVKALVDVLKGGAYSNIALSGALSASDLSREDKAFASALFYGVLDRKMTLDSMIAPHIKIRVDRIKPFTLNALRIALYQIGFMDKVPQSAAVNESVNIVKRSKERFNASFVNGVLRACLREPASLPQGTDAASLSVRYSCDESIVRSFIEDYGAGTAEALLAEALKKPPLFLRVNTLKTDTAGLVSALSEEGVEACACEPENAVVVNSSIDVAATAAYKDGLFHVEDTASQRMLKEASPAAGMRVLDICSAPGGKAFTMAQYMGDRGEIVACDLYPHRVALIKSGAERLGINMIKPVVNDALVFNSELGVFDFVLCDVPCSGLGVIRRKPEIKYKIVSDEEYAGLLKIQRGILENADKYLKPGGILVYSTCTLRKAENAAQISAFLDKHPDYDVKCNVEYMPHIDGTDGFFNAVMYKKR